MSVVVYVLCIFTGDGHFITTLLLRHEPKHLAVYKNSLFILSKDKQLTVYEDMSYTHEMRYDARLVSISEAEAGDIILTAATGRMCVLDQLFNYIRCIHTYLTHIRVVRVTSHALFVLCIVPTSLCVLSLAGDKLLCLPYRDLLQVPGAMVLLFEMRVEVAGYCASVWERCERLETRRVILSGGMGQLGLYRYNCEHFLSESCSPDTQVHFYRIQLMCFYS